MAEVGLPALWGGVECTINRVGARWHDQLDRSGHRDRLDDFDRFAALGIRALRHAVPWERHPTGAESWAWPDASLARLETLGVEPVVGLLHHGSGPPGTSLVADDFVAGLVAHAGRVARRYPAVTAYTPVNEPLTTARFSGLYGFWYPHARDDLAFGRALLNQCRATVLAMREIRRVTPEARLVQTEDLGRIYATPRLAYQAELENERRFITWDLLCGRIDFESPFVKLLLRAGIDRGELQWFADHPCPPDLVGINHYITSDRFLDDRLEHYPDMPVGGNGRHRYVDVEAVRVRPELHDGWRRSLSEAWERYGLPIAITEAHLGCTRDEQLRWLSEAWAAACDARAAGQDVRAVTAWSLLGSFDWDSLLVRNAGRYEPGAFDVRGAGEGGEPRPTALAQAIRELGAGRRAPLHPCADTAGWWRRPIRVVHGAAHRGLVGVAGAAVVPGAPPDDVTAAERAGASRRRLAPRPLLVVGAAGNLGKAFARLCELRGLATRLLRRQDLDLCSPRAVDALLRDANPWAVVNAAGYVRVDAAEQEAERCDRDNATGAIALAAACARYGVRYAGFSSDLVFDGARREPYVESSPVAPLNAYGRSKARMEAGIAAACPDALVIRTSAFFGPWHEHDFLTVALRALARRESFVAMDDVVVSSTYVPDLANACLDLLIDGETGLWHVANPGAMSWLHLAHLGARMAGLDARGLSGRSCAEFNLAARRPAWSVLGTERGLLLPSLEDALSRYIRDSRSLWNIAA